MIFAGHLFCVLTAWQGLPDPDSDADRHQNVISWSLGHTPALHKISSKSVGNFFDNPVISSECRFRTSDYWIRMVSL